MKISIKSNLDMPEIVNNRLSLDYLKTLVSKELKKIEALDILIGSELTDEEYLKKALEVYDVDLKERDDTPIADKLITSIPMSFTRDNDSQTIWYSRMYEVLKTGNIDVFKVYDEKSLQELVSSGDVVLINVEPGQRIRYEYSFMLRDSNANKIETLATMDRSDPRFIPNLAKAVRKYSMDRLQFDKKMITKKLKSQLDYLKRWGKMSSELTEERLIVEQELIGYCEEVLEEVDKTSDEKKK